MNIGSRLLTLGDVEAAANVLALAFQDDPLCAFMLPNRRTRTATLRKFFRAAGAINIRHGRVYGAGDPLQGVAFWESPDHNATPVSVKMLGKFLPLLFTQYPLGLYRARPILREIDALHAAHAPEPHYYLDNLGVLPTAQGQGFASRLIRPVLEMADSRRALVYTDTVTPANVPLYEHFGFERVATKQIANTGVTVFALKRPARGLHDSND